MKIKKIHFQNYKKFVQPVTIDFSTPSGEINRQVLLVGDNGAGKSSILQAIVALVGAATVSNFDIEAIDWPGFEYRLLQSGDLPLKIEIEVVFSDLEREATLEYMSELRDMGFELQTPTSFETVVLYLDFAEKKVKAKQLGSGAIFQFSGHQYAKQIAKLRPDKSKYFERVGNIYWYTEQRNAYSLSHLLESDQTQIDAIRSFLASAYSYHLAIKNGTRTIQTGEFDFYSKLESLYTKVFPDRKFVGSAPRFDIYEQSKAPDFFLSDGKNQYELSGMSAGERAIFPILMEFARWNINHSIIIIDEVDLHLHPPLQQQFVHALLKMGTDNQFIFTSHSDYVASMFDEEEHQIIRLEK